MCRLAKQKIVSEYDLEIPQSQNADKLMAQRGRATPLGRAQKSNKANLSNLYLRRRVILEKLINHKT